MSFVCVSWKFWSGGRAVQTNYIKLQIRYRDETTYKYKATKTKGPNMHRLRIGDHCCIESNHLFPLNKISKNMAYISLTQIRNHCTNLWESWKWVKSSQLWTIVSPQISFQNVLNVYDEALRSPDFSKSVVFGQTPQIFHKHPRQLKFKHILWSVISIHGTEGTNEKTLWCLHVYSMICYGFKWVYNYFFMSTILCFLVMENQDKWSDLIRQNIIGPLGFSFLFLIIRK